MSIQIRPLQGDMAAELSGIKICADLSPTIVQEIESAFSKYAVLVFRNQAVDDDIQQDFIGKFGPPMMTAFKELERSKNFRPYLLDIATVDEDGNQLEEGSFVQMYMLANQMWHTDGSQSQPPARLTALSARVLPPNPPNTEYADMRAAWSALPAEKQLEIQDLQVEHSVVYSRGLLGMTITESLQKKLPVQHPLVRWHPKSGRKSLYLSSHASHVIGWPIEKGRKLLKELTDFATERRFVYAHEWQPNDLVMWDDSCSMHRALPYSDPHPRVMRWSAVREVAPV